MLDTLGVRLVEGRAFTRDDVLRNTEQLRALNATERVRDASGIAAATVTVPAIITRAYAKLMFPEGQPLGKTFEDEDGDRWQVVGVIDHFYNPYAWKIGEYVTFYPQRQGSYEGGHLVPGARQARTAHGGREGRRGRAGRRQHQPHLPRPDDS